MTASRSLRSSRRRPGSRPRDRRAARAIRIVIVDPYPIDRLALATLLATWPECQVAHEAGSGHEAVERCRTARPDVVLLDTQLLEEDGSPTIAAIAAVSPRTGVIVIASRDEQHCVVLNPPRRDRPAAASDRGRSELAIVSEPVPSCDRVTDCLHLGVLAGARGAIRRSATPDELFRAIREVAAGRAWLEAGTAARLARRDPESARSALPAPTERERDVAARIAEGLSNKQIATVLGISEATVKRHVGRLLAKFGVQDRLQLGLFMARHPRAILAPGAPLRRRASG